MQSLLLREAVEQAEVVLAGKFRNSYRLLAVQFRSFLAGPQVGQGGSCGGASLEPRSLVHSAVFSAAIIPQLRHIVFSGRSFCQMFRAMGSEADGGASWVSGR